MFPRKEIPSPTTRGPYCMHLWGTTQNRQAYPPGVPNPQSHKVQKHQHTGQSMVPGPALQHATALRWNPAVPGGDKGMCEAKELELGPRLSFLDYNVTSDCSLVYTSPVPNCYIPHHLPPSHTPLVGKHHQN